VQIIAEQKIYYNKNGVIVKESQISDVFIMSSNLRETDRNEIWASHHHTPEEALRISYETSDPCFTVDIKGVPVAMFGINSGNLLGDTATIWLLATDGLSRVSKSLIKESRNFINMFLSYYPTLENYVDARNTASIQWLRYCGAQIEEAKPYGKEKLPFHHFTFRRNRA
jgi:hypothetical protein